MESVEATSTRRRLDVVILVISFLLIMLAAIGGLWPARSALP